MAIGKLLLCASLLAVPSVAYATYQEGDVLLFDGEQLRIPTFPLQGCPLLDPRLELKISPGRLSSAIWRGYVANWQIEDDVLWLVHIDAWLCVDPWACEPASLETMFPDRVEEGRVRASWYSGWLLFPGSKWGSQDDPLESEQLWDNASLRIYVCKGIVTQVDDQRCWTTNQSTND